MIKKNEKHNENKENSSKDSSTDYTILDGNISCLSANNRDQDDFEHNWENYALPCILSYNKGERGIISPLNSAKKNRLIRQKDWDGANCPTCGQIMEHYPRKEFGIELGNALTISHSISRKIFGGTNEEWNLRPSCNWCNRTDGIVVNNHLLNMDNISQEERIRIAQWSMSLDYEEVSSDEIHPVLNKEFTSLREQVEKKYCSEGVF